MSECGAIWFSPYPCHLKIGVITEFECNRTQTMHVYTIRPYLRPRKDPYITEFQSDRVNASSHNSSDFPAKFLPRWWRHRLPRNLKDTRVNSPSQVTLIRFVFFRQVLSIGRFRLCLTLGANKILFGLAHTVVWLYWATLAVVAFCGKRAIHLMAA